MSYRKVGESAWKTGLPLLRLQGERVTQPNVFALVSPNMFAGSILDLEPDTAYEARFVLTDPDGVTGPAANATKTVTVRTRPEPKPAEGGKVYHVYPVGYTGAKTEPAFTGIMCAYNYYCGAGDTAPGGRPRVKAGRHHPGPRRHLRVSLRALREPDHDQRTTTTFEGTYYLTADGTPERPIVIKAAGDGEVIIDGRGNFNLFNVKAADYNYFEGITFRNTDIAIWAGTQFIAGSKGLTVKRCRFEQVGMGVFSNYSGSSNFYIADSVFLGRNDSKHLIGWNGAFWEQFNGVEGQEFPPVMKSYTAIRLYGPGHVVAYNHVADFHDGIDTEMYGMPDGSHAHDGPSYPPREYWDRRPVAIDIYNNYITNAHDNSIEMDGSMHNIRLMRNVLINSASHPMSTQPSVGGPIYWIRNIVYHAPGGSTRMTAGSPGVLFYHNTVTTETSAGSSANSHWRNNLMLGQGTAPAIFSVNTSTSYSSSDYNGFRPNPGAAVAFRWNVGTTAGAGRGGHSRVCDACRLRPGDSPGSEQHHARLRRVRECAEARSRSEDRATAVRLQGRRLPPEAWLGGDRSRRGACEHQRRLHREGAGPRRAGSRSAAADLRPAPLTTRRHHHRGTRNDLRSARFYQVNRRGLGRVDDRRHRRGAVAGALPGFRDPEDQNLRRHHSRPARRQRSSAAAAPRVSADSCDVAQDRAAARTAIYGGDDRSAAAMATAANRRTARTMSTTRSARWRSTRSKSCARWASRNSRWSGTIAARA